MTSYTPPTGRSRTMSPLQSTKPSTQSPFSNTGSVHSLSQTSQLATTSLSQPLMNSSTPPMDRHEQISPLPSATFSLQSQTSTSESVYGFPRTTQPTTIRSSSTQVALYHDGPQVTHPQRTVPKKQVVPTQQRSLREDRDRHFLEYKRKEMLKEIKEGKQEPQENQKQEEHQIKQEPQDQHHAQPQEQYPLAAPQQQLRQMPKGSDSGPASRTQSMDDYDQTFPPNFMYQRFFMQQMQMQMQPQPTQGHTYGKVIAKGKSRVFQGNILSSKSTGLERRHTYGDVETEGEGVQLHQGDVTEKMFPNVWGPRK